MKIGFSGFQGSGKTTAAHRLVSELKLASKTCNLVSGAARSSRRLLLGDVSLDTHLEIIGAQLMMEAQALHFAEIAVCDRTVLDYVAYGRCRGLHKGPSSAVFDSVSEFCKTYAQTYQVIFLVKGSFPKQDDDHTRRVGDVSEQCFEKEMSELVAVLAPSTQLVVTSSSELFLSSVEWLKRSDDTFRAHLEAL